MATETDYAWAAGFTDGEGCVSVRMHKRVYPNIQLIWVQKVIDPLLKMQEIFGTSLKIGIVRRQNRRNTYYRLTFSGKTAISALRLMLPYLTVKRKVVETALELYVVMQLGITELELRKQLIGDIHWLNTGQWAAATTKSEGRESGCDSLVCNDDKVAEVGRNDRPTLQ